MKKRFLILLSLLMLLPTLVSTFYAAWLIEPEVKDNIEIAGDKWPCKIDNYLVTNGTAADTPYASYASLEGAINSAQKEINKDTSKYKVRMFLNVNSKCLVLNKNLVLTAGMFLYMPYEGIKYNITSDNEVTNLKKTFIDVSNDNIKQYNKSSITLKSSTLTINSGAELFIGGEFGEKGICRNYTQINLDSKSQIIVKETLNCHGYIKQYFESSKKGLTRDATTSNNEPLVEVKEGGLFTTAVVFYNAADGSSKIEKLNSLHIFPISIFDFPNIQIKLKINTSSTFKGCARLSRSNSMGTTNVNKEVTLIANSGALFNLTTGYILLHYKPSNTDGFTKANTKTYINICGEVTLGYFEIKMDSTNKISTKDCFLPISYKLQITIDKGAVFNTSLYKLKFLPGTILTINGTFKNSSEVIAYTNNLGKGSLEDYYGRTSETQYLEDNYDDALIIVNGKLEMSSGAKLGAYIKTEMTDGSSVLDFSKLSNISYLECTSKEGINETPVYIRSTTDFLDDDGNTVVVQLVGNKTISSVDNNACFANNGKIKSCKLKITVSNENNYQYPVCGYQVYKVNGSNSTIITTEGIYLTSDIELVLEAESQYKVISLDRAEQTSFTLYNGNTTSLPIFADNSSYTLSADTEIKIKPGEGVMCWFSCDSESGAGGSKSVISESKTKNGTYYTIALGTGGNTVKAAIRINSYIKYNYELGLGASTVGKQYLFAGLVSGLTDENQSSGKQYSNNSAILITQNSTVHQYLECVLPTARVLMANGTYKNAIDIKTGDWVISFNHENGKLEPNVVIGNDHRDIVAQNYQVTHLEFNNGKSTDFIYEHCYFDITLNKYVYLHENDVSNFIGHEFAFVDNGKITSSKLISFSNKQVFTKLAAPATANHLNLVVDDMLSMEGGLSGLFNIFDYDRNTLAFDKEKMNADINKYGLLDYSYFEKYFPKEIYDLLPCKYLAVSIGKGLITWDIFEGYVNKWKDQLLENIQ